MAARATWRRRVRVPLNDVRGADRGSAAEPAPIACPVVVWPYEVVSPHSNQAFVSTPFELTVPFSVAPVVVRPVAAPVVAVGAGQLVVKERSAPFVVPPELVAVALKWYVVQAVRLVRFAVSGPAVEPEPIMDLDDIDTPAYLRQGTLLN